MPARRPLLAFAFAICSAATAGAAPLRLSLDSDFPVSIAAHAALQAHPRVELGLSTGFLPSPYADFINDSIVAMGGYDEETADLIRQALGESFVMVLRAGTPLFARFRLSANYSLVTLGGSTTTSDAAATLAGITLPFGQRGRTVDIGSSLHMAGFELTWPFALGRVWELQLGLGARFTLNASTELATSPRSSGDERYLRDAEQELDAIFEHYAHTPVLSLRFARAF